VQVIKSRLINPLRLDDVACVLSCDHSHHALPRAHPLGLLSHLEYRPLVNARAHRLGGSKSNGPAPILNDRLRAQYMRLLQHTVYRRIATGTPLQSDEALAFVYYLLLQVRRGAAAG